MKPKQMCISGPWWCCCSASNECSVGKAVAEERNVLAAGMHRSTGAGWRRGRPWACWRNRGQNCWIEIFLRLEQRC